jgi:D-alanyl-D-alanine carboxypeptidase (penicillin-binding protein 5/6)
MMQVKLEYTGPVPAPIAKGQPVGRVVVNLPDWPGAEAPLVAVEGVERLGTFGRLNAAVRHVLMGKSS